MRRYLLPILTCCACCATAHAQAPAQPDQKSQRFGVYLHVTMSESIAFQETRRLSTPYDTPAPLEEHGRFNARYDFDSAPGVEAAFRVRLYRSVALWLGYTAVNRNGTADVDLSLPHPFYANRTRSAQGSDDSYDFMESAFHADAALLFGLGPFQGTLLAGASVFNVEASIVDNVSYRYTYPYEPENLGISALPQGAASDSPIGFDCGLVLDLPFGRHFGAGLLLRYSRARARLEPESGDPIVIDVGGPQASAGVHLYF